MRTKEELKEKLSNYVKLLDDEENQDQLTQAKLWAWIDCLNWVLRG